MFAVIITLFSKLSFCLDKLYFATSRYDAADAGFDDEFLYTEISLPFDKRSIPTEQCLRDDALIAFQKWNSLDYKIRY